MICWSPTELHLEVEDGESVVEVEVEVEAGAEVGVEAVVMDVVWELVALEEVTLVVREEVGMADAAALAESAEETAARTGSECLQCSHRL